MDNHGRILTTLESRSNDRSVGEILGDIAGNTQDIIRSEIELAKIELGEAARGVRASSIAFVAGGLSGIYAVGFILLAAMFALEIVLPTWLAALIIGVVLLIGGAIGVSKGRQLFKRVRPPEKTIETVKEDLRWMKEQVKS